jgi:hypothetical protein
MVILAVQNHMLYHFKLYLMQTLDKVKMMIEAMRRDLKTFLIYIILELSIDFEIILNQKFVTLIVIIPFIISSLDQGYENFSFFFW